MNNTLQQTFLTAVKERRTNYALTGETTISNDKIQQIVSDALMHTPSAFNSQTGRAVILYDDHHESLWNMVREALRAIVPEESFDETNARITAFQKGYATVLFFEDQDTVHDLQKNFPGYAHNFPLWSLQSSGMLQFIIWTAFKQEGLGASLQHYNELIEKQVKDKWDIPESWKLISQMPFGKPYDEPGDKEFLPLDTRMKVFE